MTTTAYEIETHEAEDGTTHPVVWAPPDEPRAVPITAIRHSAAR
ncbi:hypothetical protein [Streptomyces sp. NPDC048665]